MIPRFCLRPEGLTESFAADVDTQHLAPRFKARMASPARAVRARAGDAFMGRSGRTPAVRDYSAMSTTARPWISRLRSAV